MSTKPPPPPVILCYSDALAAAMKQRLREARRLASVYPPALHVDGFRVLRRVQANLVRVLNGEDILEALAAAPRLYVQQVAAAHREARQELMRRAAEVAATQARALRTLLPPEEGKKEAGPRDKDFPLQPSLSKKDHKMQVQNTANTTKKQPKKALSTDKQTRIDRWVRLALQDVSTATDGNRNDTLSAKSWKLFGWVKFAEASPDEAGYTLDGDQVHADLEAAARGAGMQDQQIASTLKSQWNAVGTIDPFDPNSKNKEPSQPSPQSPLQGGLTQEHRKKARLATRIWNGATPAPLDHAYIQKKKLGGTHGARVSSFKKFAGWLVLPVQDWGGRFHSIQHISPDGEKRLLKGGTKKGFHIPIRQGSEGAPLIICEGWATGCSISERLPDGADAHIVAAVDCGNLKAVAASARARWQDRQIIIAADIGAEDAAREAVAAAGGFPGAWMVVPAKGDGEKMPKGADFNDLATEEPTFIFPLEQPEQPPESTGAEAKTEQPAAPKQQFKELRFDAPTAEKAHQERPEQEVFLIDGKPWEQPPKSGTRVSNAPPSDDEIAKRGSIFICHPTGTEERGAGIYNYFMKWDAGAKEKLPAVARICTPILIEAETHSLDEDDFGLSLVFRVRGKWRRWNLPREMMGAPQAKSQIVSELLRRGARIFNQRAFFDYLMYASPINARLTASELGWHGDSFVMPDRSYGGEQPVEFQPETAPETKYCIRGTLQGWQEQIGALAVGNQTMQFSISASLAGPILGPFDISHGIGFHWEGVSGVGKTTLLHTAISVWGAPKDLKRNWDSTKNGMEARAAESNDLLLPIDEMGVASPKDIGAIVYKVMNGIGRMRANQRGFSRKTRRWRTVLMSTGELSLDAKMSAGGGRMTAGQDIRLPQIPVEGGRYGAFDELHGIQDGAAFAEALEEATINQHGAIGRAWLEWLTGGNGGIIAKAKKRLKGLMKEFGGRNHQERRVAKSFAVIAVAGELGIYSGLLPWSQGDAIAAAKAMFRRWVESRESSGAIMETEQAITRVRDAIQRRWAAFPKETDMDGSRIPDQLGVRKDNEGGNGEMVCIFLSAFKEIIGELNPTRARKALKEAGFLVHDKGKLSKKVWLLGKAQSMVAVSDAILGYGAEQQPPEQPEELLQGDKEKKAPAPVPAGTVAPEPKPTAAAPAKTTTAPPPNVDAGMLDAIFGTPPAAPPEPPPAQPLADTRASDQPAPAGAVDQFQSDLQNEPPPVVDDEPVPAGIPWEPDPEPTQPTAATPKPKPKPAHGEPASPAPAGALEIPDGWQVWSYRLDPDGERIHKAFPPQPDKVALFYEIKKTEGACPIHLKRES